MQSEGECKKYLYPLIPTLQTVFMEGYTVVMCSIHYIWFLAGGRGRDLSNKHFLLTFLVLSLFSSPVR